MGNSDSVLKRFVSRVEFSDYSLVLFLITVSLIVRLFYAWKPVDWLIDKGISDDAFYYFQIARNIAQRKGVTFDGLAPTNGFHPLYMAILVPIYSLLPNNPDQTVNLVLSIDMFLNVLTALSVYQLVRITMGKKAALVSLIAWLFNPWVYMITLTAVESAVYVLFVSLASLVYVIYQKEGTFNASIKWPLILGFLVGIAILGRTDGAFLLLAILVDRLFGFRNNFISQNGKLKIDRIAHIFVLVFACGLILLPWLGWNYLTFGSILQVSGKAVLRTNHFGINTDIISTSRAVLESSLYAFVNVFLLSFQAIFLCVILIIFRIIPRYNRYARQPLEHPSLIKRPLRFLLIYGIFWFLFYSWIFWGRQAWYYMPVLFIVTILTGILYYYFDYSVKSSILGPQSLKMITSFLIGSFIISILIWRNPEFHIYPLQRNGFTLAQWLSQETELDARIGTWNSGILGYFSNRMIINLDGVVNNGLHEYVIEREISVYDIQGLYDYFEEEEIDYITDYENIFDDFSRSRDYSDYLELIHEFPSVDGQYNVRIFRVVQ